jgi:hypothetical protein
VRLAALGTFLMLAGCDLVFKVEVPDLCRDAGPFSTPRTLGGVSQAHVYDPALRDDGLELFYVELIGDFDIFVATRASVDEDFAPPQTVYTTVANELDPALTLDGLHLFYIVDNQLFEAERRSRDEPFGPGQQHADLPNLESFDISYDGLAIYYNEPFGDLYVATRATPLSPFSTPIAMGEPRAFPSVSHDQLELLFQDSGQIFRVTRDSTAAAFDTTPEPIIPGSDPELSDSGEELVFGPPSQEGLAISTRLCN